MHHNEVNFFDRYTVYVIVFEIQCISFLKFYKILKL